MTKQRKLVELPTNVLTAAIHNFYMMERRAHSWMFDFLNVSIEGIMRYDGSRSVRVLPHIARKLEMLASPHHLTLYRAYCVRRGLLCQEYWE